MEARAHDRNDAPATAGKPRLQYAALPFRDIDGVEIMLISSRETRRWVLPKGWPIKGEKPHAVAAIEALEEAGLSGDVAKKALGGYHYLKRMRNGAALLCEVRVFALRVLQQHKKWPERGQRTTRWFPAHEAATLVHEPELQALIRAFADATDVRDADTDRTRQRATRQKATRQA